MLIREIYDSRGRRNASDAFVRVASQKRSELSSLVASLANLAFDHGDARKRQQEAEREDRQASTATLD